MILRAGRSIALCVLLAACAGDTASPTPTPTPTPPTTSSPVTMTVLGRGDFKPLRYSAEVFVRGTTAYTSTWGNSDTTSAFYIWNVTGNTPALVDSVLLAGAQGKRHKPRGECRAGARRRSARMMGSVPRVARRRKRQIKRRAADRKFMQRQFAEHDRAGGAQTADDHRVFTRNIVEQDFGVAGGRQARNVDDVLDADRHAVQGSARAARKNFLFRPARRG